MSTENTQDLTDVIEVEYSAVQYTTKVEEPRKVSGRILGKPFRVGATGVVYNTFTGKPYKSSSGDSLPPITRKDMEDAIAIFKSGRIIHLNEEHDRNLPVGRVEDLWLTEEDGQTILNCLPSYTETGVQYVEPKKGELFCSPGYKWRPYYDPRAENKLLGNFLLDHVALTMNPAQHHSLLSEVSLSEPEALDLQVQGENTMEELTPDQLKAMMDENASLKVKVDELSASLEKVLEENAMLKAKMDESVAEDVQDAEAEMQLSEKLAEMEHNLSEVSKELASSREKELKLSEEVASYREKAYIADKTRVIEALYSAGKATEAERKGIEMAYDTQFKSGGPEIFTTIYGNRIPNTAVPAPEGHGQSDMTLELSADPAEREIQLEMQKTGKNILAATLAVAARNDSLFRKAK